MYFSHAAWFANHEGSFPRGRTDLSLLRPVSIVADLSPIDSASYEQAIGLSQGSVEEADEAFEGFENHRSH